MVLQEICAPALIYLVFSITQIVIDTMKGMYNLAFIKLWVALIFTILLNFLCNRGLGIISWIIVFIPFILMTVIVTLLLLMFGLDPLTGRRSRVIVKRPKHHTRHRRQSRSKDPDYLDTKYHQKRKGQKLNSEYDESNISPAQKQVLTDVVQSRSHLESDPLQK